MGHNDGGPAFPVLDHKIGYHADIRQKEAGISVRDYFAAKALATTPGYASEDLSTWTPEHFANHAYSIADAMLKARGTQS